jgi:hypothetical protein
MKQLLPAVLLLLISTLSYSQKNNQDEAVTEDTASHTVIESVLRQTNVMQKVEYIDVKRVKSIYFQIIFITNLKTGEKTKGLYLSNEGPPSFFSGFPRYGRHAYLDESEIEDLIEFLENCDTQWKNTTATSQTHYEFETVDNLRFSFWARKNSSSWTFNIKFSNYFFNNTETLGKSQSDDLYAALRQVKEDLEKY